jgi:hypothetical protein
VAALVFAAQHIERAERHAFKDLNVMGARRQFGAKGVRSVLTRGASLILDIPRFLIKINDLIALVRLMQKSSQQCWICAESGASRNRNTEASHEQ